MAVRRNSKEDATSHPQDQAHDHHGHDHHSHGHGHKHEKKFVDACPSEPAFKVISYRESLHLADAKHASDSTDGAGEAKQQPNVLVVNRAVPEKDKPLSYRCARFAFTIFIVHNFWYVALFIIGAYFVCRHSTTGLIAVLVGTALYIPTYLANAQQNGGRPIEWLRNMFLWEYTFDWLQLEIARTAKLDPTQNYVVAAYPHGILIHSRVLTFGNLFQTLFPGVSVPRTLAASAIFRIPFARDLALFMGAVDAEEVSAQRVLDSKQNVLVFPGGSKEIFATNPHSKETLLLARTGFVRLAIQNGASLVPVHVIGEKYLHGRLFLPAWLHNFFLQTLRIPIIIFWGLWGTWVPFRDPKRPLSVIFGAPIPCERHKNPTREQIQEKFDLFMKAQTELFERYKFAAGYDANETLRIVDAKKHQ